MKKNRICLIAISLLLVCTTAINLTGCATKIQAKSLMDGIKPNEVKTLDDLGSQNVIVTDFAIRLLQATEKSGESTLISPLSVLSALAMTANGAEEETLKQMEAVFGMTREELNLYLYSYIKTLSQGDKYKLSLANSIWFTDDESFTVSRDFLQVNADYYGADIYETSFNKQTCKDINNWVKQKTNKMIPKILDQVSSDAVMYLVNALAFEAEWSDIYLENQVRAGKFTNQEGTQRDVEFMYSSEYTYLEDEKATGFMKYYDGGKYAFVALLPNAGISVSEYIASLDGESLNTLLMNRQSASIYTSIPKFKSEYTVDMSEILNTMGMTDAFDSQKADFGSIATSGAENIYINRILHKAYISVDERGTKAGAATVVEALNGSGPCSINIYLDRPFIYMLIDCENNIPFFIGTVMDIQK